MALKAHGYLSGEIYGTTWGDGGVTPAGLVELKCSYVKQIRWDRPYCPVLQL
jgi:hypothetical protein